MDLPERVVENDIHVADDRQRCPHLNYINAFLSEQRCNSCHHHSEVIDNRQPDGMFHPRTLGLVGDGLSHPSGWFFARLTEALSAESPPLMPLSGLRSDDARFTRLSPGHKYEDGGDDDRQVGHASPDEQRESPLAWL
jgi:hypothetical protein